MWMCALWMCECMCVHATYIGCLVNDGTRHYEQCTNFDTTALGSFLKRCGTVLNTYTHIHAHTYTHIISHNTQTDNHHHVYQKLHTHTLTCMHTHTELRVLTTLLFLSSSLVMGTLPYRQEYDIALFPSYISHTHTHTHTKKQQM